MILYHVGLLANDREHDPALDALAEEYLEKATPRGHKVRPILGDDSPRGRGEGRLFQRKRWPRVYEYYYVPNAPRKIA